MALPQCGNTFIIPCIESSNIFLRGTAGSWFRYTLAVEIGWLNKASSAIVFANSSTKDAKIDFMAVGTMKEAVVWREVVWCRSLAWAR
jgi:hypothetical protein